MRVRKRIVIGETCLDVCTDEVFVGLVPGLALEARGVIEGKIRELPKFGTSLVPVAAAPSDRALIRSMCRAGELASVGPMAAVAGAVAYHVIGGLVSEGCGYAVIDNGGDIAMISDGEVIAGLYTGSGGTSRFGLRFPCTDGIMGICSSSAKVGPSLSLGGSDIATVISHDPVLADACATRLGNDVRSADGLADAAERICGIPGVIGCAAVIGGKICVCGDVPEPVLLG